MNKEILEITKEFHDTYEKLASEYTYETREDTKVFDINSNNGKLMYATVNEIVSPILKENKILRENAEHNDKVVDKVNWENMLLKKENKQLKQKYENAVADYETTMFEKEQLNSLVNSCQEEIRQLKKQLEEANKKLYLCTPEIPQNIHGKYVSYVDLVNEMYELKKQQQEFINYLEDEIKFHKNRDSYMVADIHGSYDLNDIELKLLEEILQKYKEITRGKDEKEN